MYRALKTFVGKVSMRKGEERELKADKAIIDNLVKVGYIEKVKPTEKTKKGTKENGDK